MSYVSQKVDIFGGGVDLFGGKGGPFWHARFLDSVTDCVVYTRGGFRGLGPVSVSTTDCPTGRRTILPCYLGLSIAEWSDARS